MNWMNEWDARCDTPNEITSGGKPEAAGTNNNRQIFPRIYYSCDELPFFALSLAHYSKNKYECQFDLCAIIVCYNVQCVPSSSAWIYRERIGKRCASHIPHNEPYYEDCVCSRWIWQLAGTECFCFLSRWKAETENATVFFLLFIQTHKPTCILYSPNSEQLCTVAYTHERTHYTERDEQKRQK